MSYFTSFDPWKSKICTCPFKYTFNPYTGCGHACIYCYASSYIKNFFDPRPKSINFAKLKSEAKNLKDKLVSLSNSTDPYQPLEAKFELTRKILEILIENQAKIQIITKSNLIERDLNLLKKGKVQVAFTLTTLNEEIARKLEPKAPLPKERLKTIKKLTKKFKVVVRYDPIIPFLNDKEVELIKRLAKHGVKQVIASTFKVKLDSWQRFSLTFPSIAKKLKELYFKKGERIRRYWYLPFELRKEILSRVKEWVETYGMKFSTCRENLKVLNSAKSCDGSWLIE